MELQVFNSKTGAIESSIALNAETFSKPYNEALIHQVVTACFAGMRQGSKAQKTRAEVRGGGKKPWRQKGTGRARVGSIRSPLWRGGGVIFAAKPRDFSVKVNKKMYRGAMQSIVSELVRQERVVVLNELEFTEPKTKNMLALLSTLKLQDNSVLVITHDQDDYNLYLSARNIPRIAVCHTSELDPVSLIHFERVVLTPAALKHMEETLQ
jgi:large subunit ribosomal protein L4